MARSRQSRRSRPGLNELVVLDSEGLSKAALGDRSVQAWLERARELDADVVVSAVTLAEVLRESSRDVGSNRVLKAVEVWAVTEALARRAGTLLWQAHSDATVDAVVAATALAAKDRYKAPRCVVLTSDPGDLSALLGHDSAMSVIPV